jgi:hypothetical protein
MGLIRSERQEVTTGLKVLIGMKGMSTAELPASTDALWEENNTFI